MEGSRYRPYELKLAPGDVLFVYTDGVAEATDAANELYGTDRMLDALNGASEAKPEALLEAVKADIDRFVGEAPQFDGSTTSPCSVCRSRASTWTPPSGWTA